MFTRGLGAPITILMNNAVNVTIHTATNQFGATSNVWVDGIPTDWTDREVQAAMESLADTGNAVARIAIGAVVGCWVDLSVDGRRVYLDAG